MVQLIATVVLAALTFAPSIQDGSKSDSQSDKTNATHHNAQRKKQVPPPAAPVPSQSKVDQPSFHYNQTNTEEPAKPVHSWIDLLNALSTAVIAAFTLAMWRAIHNQNRAFRIAERAWIVPHAPSATQNSNGEFDIRWLVENKGRTPAWVTELGSAGKPARAEAELPQEPPYTMAGPFPPEGSVLPPEGKTERGITIPPAQMARLEQGLETLYVFGIVKYRDIFQAKHETKYCY